MKIVIYLFLASGLAQVLKAIPETGNPPPARTKGVLLYHSSLKKVFVFAGQESSAVIFDDIWTYDLSSSTWEQVYPLNSGPGSLHSACGFVYNSEFYIYGGFSYTGPLADLWKFSPSSLLWQLVETSGEAPALLVSPACSKYLYDSVDYFCVFGGYSKDGISSSIFILDIDQKTWKSGTESDVAVAGGSLQYSDGKLYLFGGATTDSASSTEFLDLLTYDLQDDSWTSTPTTSFLGKTEFSGGVYESTLFSFPGFSLTSSSITSQTQSLPIGESAWSNSSMPSIALSDYTAFTFSSTVYLFGGRSETSLSNQLLSISLSKSSVSELSTQSVNPGPLSSPSLTSISKFIVLFGGNKKGSKSNELWIFDVQEIVWEQVSTSGDLPSPRSHCGIASQGDVIVVWGGQGTVGYLNDFYLLNFKERNWMKVPVLSQVQPSQRFGPCIVLDLPDLYLVGGKDMNGISQTLWRFDFEVLEYSVLDNDATFEPGFSQYCELLKSNDSLTLNLGFGTGEIDQPLGYIQSFDFTSKKWSSLFTPSTSKPSRSDSVIFRSSSQIYVLGGQSWSNFLYKSIQSIDLDSNSSSILPTSLPQYLYSSGSQLIQSSIYIYGGGSHFTSIPQPNQPRSQFFQLNPQDLCSKCSESCSPGSYISGSECKLCPAGHYNSDFDSNECLACPAGTENKVLGASSSRQCYPCKEGFYSSSSGSSECLKCAEGFNCPVGSSGSASSSLSDFVVSDQPGMLKRNTAEANRIGGSIQIAVFVVGFFILFVLLFTEKTRNIIKTIDMYTDKHNYVLDVPMIKTKTFFGSVFSMVFFIVALILVIQTIILYVMDNVMENKRLIPVVIIQDTIDGFKADFSVKLVLHNYGGLCVDDQGQCVEEFDVELNDVNRESFSTSCEKSIEDNTCVFELKCYTCEVSVESTILFIMKEIFSYSTAIGVNFTSDSSIPDEPSKISTLIVAESGNLFRGPDPTTFYFSLIPSLFEDDDSEKTGYHVTSQAAAVAGTSIPPEQFGIASYQYVLVSVSSDNNSLYTERKMIYTLFLLIMALIGSVVGMMNIIGGAMSFVESQYLARKTAYDKDQKNQKLKDNRKMALKNLTTEDDYTRGDI